MKWNTYISKFTGAKAGEKGSLILGKDARLTLDTNANGMNANVLVYGREEAAEGYVIPNLNENDKDYVLLTDNIELARKAEELLRSEDYDVSAYIYGSSAECTYNPFALIGNDMDALEFAEHLYGIKKKTHGGDSFFIVAESVLFAALLLYMINKDPKENWSFNRIHELSKLAMDFPEPNSYKTRLDLLFDEYEKAEPDALAIKYYQGFKVGSLNTLKAIVISLHVWLVTLSVEIPPCITGENSMNLTDIGGKDKRAIVICTEYPGSVEQRCQTIAGLMIFQILSSLYRRVLEYRDKENRHVHIIFDGTKAAGDFCEFHYMNIARRIGASFAMIIDNPGELEKAYGSGYEEEVQMNSGTQLWFKNEDGSLNGKCLIRFGDRDAVKDDVYKE